MKRKPSQQALAAVIGVLLLLAAVASYLLLISPQRSKASELAKEADTTQAEIVRLRELSRQSQHAVPIRVADLFRLTKAMPSEVDMPGMILQLNRIARDTGIRFDSITPQAATEASGAQATPISLVLQGNYFELSDFLFRLRNLVGVRGGKLDATGRLFVVDSIAFSEGIRKFPQIQATLTVSAYSYGSSDGAGTPAAPAPAAPAATPPPATPPPAAPPATPDTPPAASAAPAAP